MRWVPVRHAAAAVRARSAVAHRRAHHPMSSTLTWTGRRAWTRAVRGARALGSEIGLRTRRRKSDGRWSGFRAHRARGKAQSRGQRRARAGCFESAWRRACSGSRQVHGIYLLIGLTACARASLGLRRGWAGGRSAQPSTNRACRIWVAQVWPFNMWRQKVAKSLTRDARQCRGPRAPLTGLQASARGPRAPKASI